MHSYYRSQRWIYFFIVIAIAAIIIAGLFSGCSIQNHVTLSNESDYDLTVLIDGTLYPVESGKKVQTHFTPAEYLATAVFTYSLNDKYIESGYNPSATSLVCMRQIDRDTFATSDSPTLIFVNNN